MEQEARREGATIAVGENEWYVWTRLNLSHDQHLQWLTKTVGLHASCTYLPLYLPMKENTSTVIHVCLLWESLHLYCQQNATDI